MTYFAPYLRSTKQTTIRSGQNHKAEAATSARLNGTGPDALTHMEGWRAFISTIILGSLNEVSPMVVAGGISVIHFGMIAFLAGCGVLGLRTITPPNTPPDISHLLSTDTLQHRGISIGGRGHSGHEIVAAADGVVVFVSYNERRGNHVKIHHGLDSNKQDIYTEHYHVHGRLIKEGDRVERGQTIGLIGVGNRERTDLPHYHYLVIKGESPGKFAALPPMDYWFGIDRYKETLKKGLDIGPFAISCFDPNANYPKEPIRFTYPVKCK